MEIAKIQELTRKAEQAHRLATACELLRAALARDPGDARAQCLYGENLRAIGRPSEAETLLRSIEVDKMPQRSRYMVPLNLALVYEDTGRFDLAEQEYALATRLRPDSTVPWVFYSGFLAKQGRVREAQDMLRNGLRAEGDLDEVHFNLGSYARALGDYELAKEHYEAAVRLTPSYAEAAHGLADISEALRLRQELAAH